MTRREAFLAFTSVLHGQRSPVWLRLEIQTQRLIESRWPNPAIPVPFGSLMKPFVALAYGAAFGFQFPELNCRSCWKPDGHGSLSLVDAVVHSCNSYFLELARACSVDDMARVATTYGIAPPASNRPEAWIGLGDGWRVSPNGLIRAFAELAVRGSEKGPALLLRGMRESARRGTAKAIHIDAYAKTGTGPCTHVKRGSGDGFAIALFPGEAPRHALLIGLHDQPGAEAAGVAGEKVRRA